MVERIESKNQPKGLGAKTVRSINQAIPLAMAFAIDQNTYPTDSCVLLKLEHREMKTVSVEQLAAYLHEDKESGAIEKLATGLRRGELLGLKWENIDLERGTIQVH